MHEKSVKTVSLSSGLGLVLARLTEVAGVGGVTATGGVEPAAVRAPRAHLLPVAAPPLPLGQPRPPALLFLTS